MRPPRAALLAACVGFAAAAVLAADDRTIFIEFDPRSGALPNAVNASGTVVGKFDDGGSFYWMPTTGVIDLGGGFGTGISADGLTIVGGSPPAPGITNAAIWLRDTLSPGQYSRWLASMIWQPSVMPFCAIHVM